MTGPTARPTKPMDFTRILPAEVNVMISQYLDINSFVRARQVCKSWRELLSESVIVQHFLAPYYSGNEPPLICETSQEALNHSRASSIDLAKLEAMLRFRHGKPAKILGLDLRLEEDLDQPTFCTDLSVIGHHAVAVWELDIPTPQPMGGYPPVTIAINLLTGTLSYLGDEGDRAPGNNTSLFTFEWMPLDDPASYQFPCINLDTLEILTFQDKDTEKWKTGVCFQEFVLFERFRSRPGKHSFLIWSSVAKRSCSYELDLDSVLAGESDPDAFFEIVQAYLDEASDTLYLTLVVKPPSGLRPHIRKTEVILLKMQFNRNLKGWKPNFHGCRKALPLIQANSSAEMKPCSPKQHAYTLIKAMSINSRHAFMMGLLKPYNNTGSFATFLGDEELIYNAMTGEMSGKLHPNAYNNPNPLNFEHDPRGAIFAHWKGIRYEVHSGPRFKVTCQTDSATHTSKDPPETVRHCRNVPLPKQKFKPKEARQRQPCNCRGQHRDDCYEYNMQLMAGCFCNGEHRQDCSIAHKALIAGNDRFMVTMKNDQMNVLAFDPDWDLDAEDFRFGEHHFGNPAFRIPEE